jgi:hypothetical protein
VSKSRWVLEGEWSGYTSAQRRVAHREVIQGMPKMRAAIKAAGCITYTDGTTLSLTTRDAKPREKVVPHLGYSSLIRDCVHYGIWRVADLPDARKAAMAVVAP